MLYDYFLVKCMISEQVRHYNLKGILDDSFITFVHDKLGNGPFKKKLQLILNLLAIYKDVKSENEVKGLTLEYLFINQDEVEKLYKGFLGFIYSFTTASMAIKYNYQQAITKIFEACTLERSIQFTKIKASSIKITNEIYNCIGVFNHSYINEWKKTLYKGWTITLSNQNVINLDLANIYITYGSEYCEQIYRMIQCYEASDLNEKSIYKKTRMISHFYNCATRVYKTLDSLKEAFNSLNSNGALLKLHNILLLEHMKKENNLGYFDNYRKGLLEVYQDHVSHEIFDTPDFDIFLPKISKQVTSSKTNLKKNSKTDEIEDNKLITVVPLALTDEEAKNQLLEEVVNDINHIVYCCETYKKEVIAEYRKFLEKGKIGQVKEVDTEGKFWQENPVKVGPEQLNNVLATYQKYPYIHPIVKNYKKFLKMQYDCNSIFYLNYEKIYCYLILLINEHPQITESAISNAKIYENGKFTGIQRVGNDAFITLYKNRRGKLLAEQKIKLNARSIQIFEELIEISTFARNYLKSINDPNYEYLVLVNTTPFTAPKRLKAFTNPCTETTRIYFENCFIRESYKEDGSCLYSIEKAKSIMSRISLTRFRASCGVRVYLDTLSTLAMSKALGHKEYSKSLIETYLPASIYNFFSERWIRIFQNAFIFEVMKDSEFLFDTIDIKPEDLHQFLKNHKLENIPEFIKDHKKFTIDSSKEPKSQAIVPISVGLLQWLIGLKNYVESRKNLNDLKNLEQNWYECATYILMQIHLSLEDKNSNLILDDQIFDMYSKAQKYPLSQELIERALV